MTDKNSSNVDRRTFLKTAAAAGAVISSHAFVGAQNAETESAAKAVGAGGVATLSPVGDIPDRVTRHWISPKFWGNRLQDWRIAEGRIECVSDKKERDLCTVSLLTREMVPGGAGAMIVATTGRTGTSGEGFSGFLLGGGSGKLDPRAAALVQRASGIGGGILCVYSPGAGVKFREHTNEKQPVLWAPVEGTRVLEAKAAPEPGPVQLQLEVHPSRENFRFDLTLTALQNGRSVSSAQLEKVAEEDILGGVMLVSAALQKPFEARFWFSNVQAGGKKLASFDDRAMGPIVGALYTVNGSVMKMTAQLMPIGADDPQDVILEVREAGSDAWIKRAASQIGEGFNALFRVADWDASKEWDYRVVYGEGTAAAGAVYEGIVKKDPGDAENIKIGLYSCTIAANRLLDRGVGSRMPSWARFLGRYTPECMCFPFAELVNNGLYHQPDILFFVGDQFYEDSPSIRDPASAPVLDYVYKWVLWMWGFRDMTRNIPTVVLTDDHDVFQPNLFGNGGRPAPDGEYNHGGYRPAAEWVNMVQRTQCGHNPDPYDPTPIDQGITVYYCTFRYGGVEFAALEDRKWKTAPWQGNSLDVHEGVLLGDRQEKMLEEWGANLQGSNNPRIVATQTIFSCVQTMPGGQAMVDFDSNGYPALARRRAMKLIRDAEALMISGDQHLATVIRNGIDDYTDGPMQFTGPAGAATWTRWFQPAEPLENPEESNYTGDFIDGFGNKCHIYAVANPENITMAEYWSDVKPPTQYIGDRDLKAEGYCMINVDKNSRKYVMECWRWDIDPSQPGAKPYDGWPVTVSFDEAGSAKKG